MSVVKEVSPEVKLQWLVHKLLEAWREARCDTAQLAAACCVIAATLCHDRKSAESVTALFLASMQRSLAIEVERIGAEVVAKAVRDA